MLTKLEDQILLTILTLGEDAYGISIYQHLEKITGSKIAVGVIYFALDRLATRGYLETFLGEPTAVRGGMRKKIYRLTRAGMKALEKSKKVNDKLWKSYSEPAFSTNGDK